MSLEQIKTIAAAAAVAANAVAVVTKEVAVRLLNCSSSGCLVETNARVDVGTVGVLRVSLDGIDVAENVRIVRCQLIEGAGSRYHVGAEFLWTATPRGPSLRLATRERPMSFLTPHFEGEPI